MKTVTKIGIIAASAALGVAAVIFAKRNCSTDLTESSDNISNKLSSFKRKAEKEFRDMKGNTETNPAAERVNKWVNSTL